MARVHRRRRSSARLSLRNGRCVLISNDTEQGRHRLAVQITDDEGKSWKWMRHLELAPVESVRFHYPGILQAEDGTLHASYSYHLEKNYEQDAGGHPRSKSIKHAHFQRRMGDGRWPAVGPRR